MGKFEGWVAALSVSTTTVQATSKPMSSYEYIQHINKVVVDERIEKAIADEMARILEEERRGREYAFIRQEALNRIREQRIQEEKVFMQQIKEEREKKIAEKARQEAELLSVKLAAERIRAEEAANQQKIRRIEKLKRELAELESH